MIVVKLSGGLGNQMFQYAFGRSLALRRRAEIKFDTSGFRVDLPRREYDLDIFNIETVTASAGEVLSLRDRSSNGLVDRVLDRLLGPKRSYLIEPHFHFSEAIYNAPDNVYLQGYWQTSKYFTEIEDTLRREFSFRNPMSPGARELLGKIKDSNSVCVNVRRGDFVTNPFHGSYGSEYFERANGIIREQTSGCEYFVFSDEIDWCEENLIFDGPTVFVSHDFAGPKFQDYLRLMAACRHFIIPNSSFAWWAVWLNEVSDKIVIAPKAWFSDARVDTRDLTPAEWILI